MSTEPVQSKIRSFDALNAECEIVDTCMKEYKQRRVIQRILKDHAVLVPIDTYPEPANICDVTDYPADLTTDVRRPETVWALHPSIIDQSFCDYEYPDE